MCGAILSIIVFTLVLFQLSEKSQVLINKGESKYYDRVVYGANNVDENSIGYNETGYNFAFGIISPDFVNINGGSDPELFNYLDVGVFK